MSLQINPSMVSTVDTLPGYRIVRSLGTVEAVSVDMFTGITPGSQSSRIINLIREALLDLFQQAAQHGANAIVGLRYTMPSAQSERIVLAYGTAVYVEKI